MQNDEQTQVETPAEEVIENEVETQEEGQGQPEKDWQAEAAKWKAIADRRAKQSSRTLPTKKEIVDDLSPMKKDVEYLKTIETKRQFGYENNLSPEETDMLFKFNPKPTKEDLNNPFVKGGLEAIRAQRRVENNTPSPSNNAPKFNGKSFNELAPEEKSKNWAELVKANAKRR